MRRLFSYMPIVAVAVLFSLFFLPIEKRGEAKWRCSAARNIGGLSGGRFGGFDKELSGLPYFVTNRRSGSSCERIFCNRWPIHRVRS